MIAQDWYTIEQVAERLGLHVATVRSYVRDGRLNAVRIGKQYRVARADFEALTGRPADRHAYDRRVEVSTVLDVDGIDGDTADRIIALLDGLPRGPQDGPALHMQTARDLDGTRVKVLTTGGVRATVEILRLVAALVEEETA
ncbi:helix-turn-helix domain-containing protein [Micromonospora sp. KC721]|uniref:helix-turn-helix domain-containing protein n=1 Tax=Micromonospora sp. KC721 TaxID=2530380 RepID=UPI001FB782B8|nr:helix-turn-helix domain-containing protein [Micromonospora sp. KC721]